MLTHSVLNLVDFPLLSFRLAFLRYLSCPRCISVLNLHVGSSNEGNTTKHTNRSLVWEIIRSKQHATSIVSPIQSHCVSLSLLTPTHDIIDIHVLLEAEESISRGRNRYLELFTIPRNRRASLASFIVMFMQQFCGVNVIAYYSTNVFKQAGNTDTQAFLASFGFGAGKLFSGGWLLNNI